MSNWQPYPHPATFEPVGIDDPDIVAQFSRFLLDFVELSKKPDPAKFNINLKFVNDLRRETHGYIVTQRANSVAAAILETLKYAICCYFDIARHTPLTPLTGIQLEECYRQLEEYCNSVETVIRQCDGQTLLDEVMKWKVSLETGNIGGRRLEVLREHPENFPPHLTLRPNRIYGIGNNPTRSNNPQPPSYHTPSLGHQISVTRPYMTRPPEIRTFSGPSPLHYQVTDVAAYQHASGGSATWGPLYQSTPGLSQNVQPNNPPFLDRRVDALRGPQRSASVPLLQNTPMEMLSPVQSLALENFPSGSPMHGNFSGYQNVPHMPLQQQGLHPDPRYMYPSTQPPQVPRYHYTGYPHPATAAPGDPILNTPIPDPLDPLLEERYPSRYIPSRLRDAGSTPYHPPFTGLPISGRGHGTRN